jgi:hypothetical protein
LKRKSTATYRPVNPVFTGLSKTLILIVNLRTYRHYLDTVKSNCHGGDVTTGNMTGCLWKRIVALAAHDTLTCNCILPNIKIGDCVEQADFRNRN